MPLPMVHLAVAHALSDEAFAGCDKAAYFLGANAPDSIHKREGWTGHDKDVSHVRLDLPKTGQTEVFRQRIADLWAARTGEPREDSFLAGCCVHLLTDWVWGKYLRKPYFEPHYQADPNPAQDMRTAYYNDTDLADLELYNACPWREEVFSLLAKAEGIAFGDMVSARETELWRDYILQFYDNMDMTRYIPARYILPEDINAFITQAADYVREAMNA
ncbi:MAG: hypothetical protein J6C51_02795 [Clostridia bacterium]|nr:hypothetical protein [Clostridia bacterium]